MRIGLVLTGGTLDSAATPQGLDARVGSGLAQALRARLKPGQSLQEFASPWRLDSSQLDTRGILALGWSLLDAPPQDAWIVVAGTDTLAWLAPSLWWMLGSLGRPVLLACGMSPWWVQGGDGETTLDRLPELLETGLPPGVHVVSDGGLLPPCGLHKISHLVRDPFRPLAGLTGMPDLASLWQRLSLPVPQPPAPPRLPLGRRERTPSVLWLPMHPGLSPQAFREGLSLEPPRHIVLGGYSGGTLPLAFLEVLQGVPSRLHLTSQQWGPLEPELYAVSSGLRGSLQVWNSGPETVTALLALADAMGLEGEDAQCALHTLEHGIAA